VVIISAGEALVDLVPNAVPGGGPMNVAIASARLGAPTTFLGRVSTDAYGQSIVAHLKASDVDLALIQRGPEPTCEAQVEGDPPVFTFRGEGTADVLIEMPDMSVVGAGPHILHGGTLGLFRMPGAEVLATTMERHDGLVSLDPNVRPQIIGDDGRANWERWHSRWLRRADLIRMSDADMEWIWPDKTVDEVSRLLLGNGCTALIVTEATRATVFTTSGTTTVESRPTAVVDTVGAGDSFVGAILVQLYEREVATAEALAAIPIQGWDSIIRFAHGVASITVSRQGANPPFRHELETL